VTLFWNCVGQGSGDLLGALGLALDDAHDVAFLHDDQLFAVELDLGAGPLAEQHPVARLDVERMEFAILTPRAGADGDDLALLRLLLGGVRDDDPAGGLFLLFEAANHHAVVQGTEMHRVLLSNYLDWNSDAYLLALVGSECQQLKRAIFGFQEVSPTPGGKFPWLREAGGDRLKCRGRGQGGGRCRD